MNFIFELFYKVSTAKNSKEVFFFFKENSKKKSLSAKSVVSSGLLLFRWSPFDEVNLHGRREETS